MKTRVCLSTDILESDVFLCMSLEAQLCYIHLNSEARPSGKIVGARRVARSYGFDDDVLQELLECGYLLDVDGAFFVTHCWVNNSYEERLYTAAMNRCEEFLGGKIIFVGEPGKSAYALPNNRQSFGNL